jgi:uncharacterized protein YecT (DUF1311 family)
MKVRVNVIPMVIVCASLGISLNANACDQRAADLGNLEAITQCASDRFVSADKELNDYYAKVVQSLKSSKKNKELDEVKKAQRKWIKEKEKACKALFNREENGVQGEIDGYDCWRDQSIKRLEGLRQKFH